MAESISELIVQNDGLIFKVAKYIIATGGFLFFFGLGLSIFLGIFSPHLIHRGYRQLMLLIYIHL